jgi:hypothetical protein
VAVVTRE